MKIRKTVLLVAILLISVLTFSGCPKKAEVTTAPEAQQEEMDRARAAEEERRAREEAARAAEEAERAAAEGGLESIYFDFDRSHIRNDARAVMKENAEWLRSHPEVQVRIEGNADERGTIEYNQALGQRRASSARKYLTDLGISSKRLSVISYGKEKPVCSESTEECWQQNRRVDFVAE